MYRNISVDAAVILEKLKSLWKLEYWNYLYKYFAIKYLVVQFIAFKLK